MSYRELDKMTNELFRKANVHPYIGLINLFLLYGIGLLITFITSYISSKFSLASDIVAAVVKLAGLILLIYRQRVLLGFHWYYLKTTRGEDTTLAYSEAFMADPTWDCSILPLIYVTGIPIKVATAITVIATDITIKIAFYFVNLILAGVCFAILAGLFRNLILCFSREYFYDRETNNVILNIIQCVSAAKGNRGEAVKLWLKHFLVPIIIMLTLVLFIFAWCFVIVGLNLPVDASYMVVGCITTGVLLFVGIYLILSIPRYMAQMCMLYNMSLGYPATSDDPKDYLSAEDLEALEEETEEGGDK